MAGCHTLVAFVVEFVEGILLGQASGGVDGSLGIVEACKTFVFKFFGCIEQVVVTEHGELDVASEVVLHAHLGALDGFACDDDDAVGGL